MIRFAAPGERASIRRLWDACFADEGGFNDYFFASCFQPEHTLVAEENGVLCAMLQMLPYRLLSRGELCEVTYIYGACTAPEYRRQGLMARLLEHSFALDREAGRVASILIPQEEWLFKFYQAFGYQTVFYLDKQLAKRSAEGIAPRHLSSVDIPQMDKLYRKAAGEAFVERDDAYWRGQIALFDALGKGVYGWFERDTLEAYAFCWEKEAQEAIGLNGAYAQGLAQALNAETILWSSPGGRTPLGCAKWHKQGNAVSAAYMNLMFN